MVKRMHENFMSQYIMFEKKQRATKRDKVIRTDSCKYHLTEIKSSRDIIRHDNPGPTAHIVNTTLFLKSKHQNIGYSNSEIEETQQLAALS
jgi:hypothetical protein